MSFTQKPSPEFIDLLKKAGSADKAEALVAQHELAKAIELPLREGVLVGDIAGGIFGATTANMVYGKASPNIPEKK